MKNTLAVGLLALLATHALGQAKLTGIETNKVGDGLQIVVQGEGLPAPRILHAFHNTSYIVEFDAKLVGKIGKEKIGFAGIQYVQYGWYRAKPPIVRVHVKSTGATNPVLAKIDGAWTISIGCPTDGLTAIGNTIEPITQSIPISKLQTNDAQEMQKAIEALKTETGVTATAQVAVPTTKPFDKAGGTVASLSNDLSPNTTTTEEPKRILPRIAPVSPSVMQQKVSLDFVGTDIVQIMKALSIQAGVNIVTSPDVSPADKPLKLTISLNNVELDQALSMVTSMAQLRYARIGNTYVVAPVASFSQIMRQIMERNSDSYQTRVVNLVSGDAEKIREATLKAMPPDGRNGFYEIIVPGQNDIAAPNAAASGAAQVGGATGDSGQAGGGTGEQTAVPANAVPSNASAKSRAYYLLIVGEPTRLNAVENFVKELDVRVAASFSLSRSQSTGTVAIPIQSGETLKIKSMIEKLLTDNPRSSDYSITETSVKELSQGEQSTKFLLMIGPDSELATLKSFAIALDKELCKPLGIDYVDDVTALIKDYEVVELRYLEPIVAAQDLKGRFKDLWVTVVPDTVTPGLTGEQDTSKAEAPTDTQQGGATGGGGGAPAAESKLKKDLGREPMKLMLRGNKATIADAKRYLAMIDKAPRQIALEMRVMDLTKEEALNVGLDWSLGLGSAGKVSILNSPGTQSGNVTLNAGSLSVTAALDSLANNHNLIARPNALVSDGREAHLFVGDTVRYVKSVQSTQNGVTVITDEVQVGSQFDIKARIGDGGSIALDLGQKFTILTSFLNIPGGGKLPQTSDRQSNLFVNMKSGETIAIGGLILEADFKNYSGVPFLKDLPIIGKLFGHTVNSHTRTEIVFFLTAVEVNDGNRADAASPQTSERNIPDPIGQYKKNGRVVDKSKLN